MAQRLGPHRDPTARGLNGGEGRAMTRYLFQLA